MTELLNSSYNYQEPYKYMTNLRCMSRSDDSNEYLEYKTFYEEDENSPIQIIKRVKTTNTVDANKKSRNLNRYRINRSKFGKSLSFGYQK
jgi:hypothetical protein